MSKRPTLVYLHGVGDAAVTESWRKPLADALKAAGYPGLDGITVYAPRYPKTLLFESDDEPTAPSRNMPKLDRDDEERLRRAYERRLADLERLVGKHASGSTNAAVNALSGAALQTVKAARRYVKDADVRALVLTRVLRALPSSGEVVLVGHSLGSIVAIDLLDHLPSALRIRALITMGSPAGHPLIHRGTERLLRGFPWSQVDVWVNFWNGTDAVSGLRGVSPLFPQALDVRLSLGPFEHRSAAFAASPPVATAIGRGLFGSLSREIQPLNTALDVKLTDVELLLLQALSYAHAVGDHMKGSAGERWRAALAIIQDSLLERLLEHYRQEGTRVPAALARCADGSRPLPPDELSKGESVEKLVTLATSNVLLPFEINVPAEVQRKAMHHLTVAMGLGSRMGKSVCLAVEEATEAVSGSRDWKRWALIGGGALLLALGPVGLMVAAPAGLAGGAAIVSALAAFGPGGMIGGLMTLGAMTTTGASTVAGALASADSSAETVEQVVIQLVASAIVREKEGLPQDPGTWTALTELQQRITRELQRLSPYSDHHAASIKELRAKADSIERAVAFVIKREFFPAATTAEDE